MSTTEAVPYDGPIGGDWTKGRFEFFHDACGTIFADSVDDAIDFAYQRIKLHDPMHAAAYAAGVRRVGFNVSGASLPEAETLPANPTPEAVTAEDRAAYEAWKASQKDPAN